MANIHVYERLMYELDQMSILSGTVYEYILLQMFQFFEFNNKKYEEELANCQFYEDDKELSLQQIEKDMVHYPKDFSFDVFVVNNDLFGSNEKFRVTRHDPYTHDMFQSSFNALYIDNLLLPAKWSATTKKGGAFQYKVRQRLVIGKECGIDVNGRGCGDGYGFGATSVGDAGAGYSTKGNGSGGGEAYGDEELSVLHYGSSAANGKAGGGIIELIAENIVNYGKVEAYGFTNASGGSIKIQCKTFVNKRSGWISARGYVGGAHGRIAIFCEQYKNEGKIYPQPFVKIIKYDENVQYTPIESP